MIMVKIVGVDSMHLDLIGSYEMHTTSFKHFKIEQPITNDQNIN
jgi:hypothetical protein